MFGKVNKQSNFYGAGELQFGAVLQNDGYTSKDRERLMTDWNYDKDAAKKICKLLKYMEDNNIKIPDFNAENFKRKLQ